MKKIYTLISMVALAALVFGCAKEIDTAQDEVLSLGDPAQVEEITVALNVPESPETKTVLGTKNGSSYPVKWSPGDGAYLSLNGTVAYESNKESDTRYTASFKPAAGLSVYNFLYRGDAGHDNQVTFPSTQNYVAGGFDPAAMPMYAASSSRSNTVTFSHLASLLKFSVTGAKKIVSVTLSAKESLSGTFTIGKTGDLLNGSLTSASGGTALMYAFGSHIQLSSTPFVFYVAIPGGTYEDGITVDIVDNESGHMTLYVMTETDQQTIEAGKVREFASVAYDPATEVNLIQISDDATFKSFVSTVAGGTKTINARLTQNLSLSTSTINSFNSIVDYKGTFDGNGKTISGLTKPMFSDLKGVVKNLTLNSNISITDASDYNLGIFARQVIPSSEVDDIAGLQNCTASGSITFTPSGEVSGNACIGGLVGNNRGGAISGCTNNATVTFANNGSSTVHAMQPSIGGVVGRTQKGGDFSSQGDIYNCTNAGTVVCGAKFSQGIYLGGVLGYQVEKAESISGCTNSGTVKASSTCSTTGPLQIGGVIGMGKGSIESCSNLASQNPDVGVITEAGCSVGTYLCQGGVVGRLNRESDSYSGLSNAGTLYVAANGGSTARLIGGVVGRCNEGATITEFTNSGDINYTAVDVNETHIGGVVAENTRSGLSLENCHSTGGKLNYSGQTTHGALYVGGVVGYSTRPITSCSNAMTLNITGTMSCDNNEYKAFGGVAGHVTGANIAVTNCTNSGAINYGQTITDEGQTYVGGVVGVLTKGEISGGGNSGTFTFTGQNTKRTPSIGGVVGRVMSNDTESGYALSNNVTNSGAIVLNSSVSSSQYLYVGGLVGQVAAGNIYGTNSGSITVTEVHASVAALGGLVGYMQGGAIVSGSANTATGDIALNGWQITYHSYVGGIAGLLGTGVNPFAAGGGTITGASNAGDITFGSGCSVTRCNFIGGVAGYAGAAISSSSNSGNIVNNYSQTAAANGGSAAVKDLCIGGIAGVSDAALSSCYNTGNVTNNGSTYNVEIELGGVVGLVNSGNLTSCSNGTSSLAGGTVSNTATSGTNSRQDMQVGGIVGNNKGGNTWTSCFNKGDVTNSGLGAKISMGGLAGWSNASTTFTSSCYNTGNLSNTGTGSSTPGLCMGGLLGVARGENTLTGNASVYNYNSGTLLDDSATRKIAIGGICGYSDNAPSDFAYARNLSTQTAGDIKIQNQTKDKIYVGGILAMSDVASSFNYASNAGKILFKDLALSSIGQVFAGGIIGGWTSEGTQTITGCVNSGCIECDSSDYGDFELADSSNPTPLWSFFGGISGMGGNTNEALNGGYNSITGKTFKNCTNSGYIWLYTKMRCCVGGVVAYTENDPDGCVCTANITSIKKKAAEGGGIGTVGNNYHRQITGGVVGLCTATSVSNAKYNGTLNTNGSSPQSYDGGIIGYTYTFDESGTSITLTNCKVGGSVRSTGSGGAALMCYSAKNNVVTYTFTNCVIKKGSIVYTTGSKVTISTSVTKNDCLGYESGSAIVTGDVLPSIADSI